MRPIILAGTLAAVASSSLVRLGEFGALVEPIDRGPHAGKDHVRGANLQHA
jgi:hypothetical protein